MFKPRHLPRKVRQALDARDNPLSAKDIIMKNEEIQRISKINNLPYFPMQQKLNGFHDVITSTLSHYKTS